MAAASLRFSLLIAALAASMAATAQTAGALTGMVRLPAGEPAVGAMLNLRNSVTATTTDVAGAWQLTAAPGAYRLQVQLLGYRTREVDVRIEAGQTTALPTIILTVSDQQLAEVAVTGQQTMNERPVAIGKVAVRPLDLPQSIVTIGQPVLEQQQAVRVSDVLANVSGVYVMGATGGTQEEIAGRGFAFGSNNTFKNGVRYNNAVMPEVSALEQFEVLKGSNAILFGSVAAGGVINLVTKKPRFESGGSVGLRAGSYGFYKPLLDVYGAVNNSQRVAFRVNTSYENGRSFRDGVRAERFYVNPSVLVKIGQQTDLLVEGDYLRDARTPDYGIGAINYVIADVPRSRFLNTRWARNATTQQSATATLAHRLGERWRLSAKAAVQAYDNELRSAARPTGIKANGDWARSTQRSQTNETYLLSEVNLTGQFRTAFLEHTLLVGADVDRYATEVLAYTAAAYDTINIFDLSRYVPRTNVPELSRNTLTKTPVGRVGGYVQDLIGVGEHVKLLAGVRYSYLETGSNVLSYARNTTTDVMRYDDAFSPRFGVVYQPRRTTAVFASYANSFALNTGIDVTGARLPPSVLRQYEAGVKNDLLGGLLSANVTAYEIVNGNLAQTVLATEDGYNPNYPAAQALAGEVKSRGVELDVLSRPVNGWSFIAGYAYNRTVYSKSNIYVVGSLLRYNPTHTANLSAYYTVAEGRLKNLNAGFTALYIGARQAGRSTRLTVNNDAYRLIALPDYVQLDAGVGYTLDRLTLRVKLTNLLNQLSYNVHDDNSVNPIAPRQLATTLTYQLF